MIGKYSRKVPYSITGGFRIGDIRHNVANVDRIKNELGFVPRISLDEGIERFIRWTLTQNEIRSHYDKTLSEVVSKH
jgi:dTDP-L-rhamnose 4-epimerase